jgi:hypothetical protein
MVKYTNSTWLIKIFTVLIIAIMVIPSIALNISAPEEGSIILDLPQAARTRNCGSTPRSFTDNYINTTNFTNGTYSDTLVHPDGSLGLAWESPKKPYEKDGNTLLLSHFEQSYSSIDQEEPLIMDKQCVGYWDFEEGAGLYTTDKSLNSNHARIYGATWVNSPNGYSLSFDGVNDYLEIPYTKSMNITDGITIEAWIKRGTVGTQDVALATNGGTAWADEQFDATFPPSNVIDGTSSYWFSLGNPNARAPMQLGVEYQVPFNVNQIRWASGNRVNSFNVELDVDISDGTKWEFVGSTTDSSSTTGTWYSYAGFNKLCDQVRIHYTNAFNNDYFSASQIEAIGSQSIIGGGSYSLSLHTNGVHGTINDKDIYTAIDTSWNHVTLTYNKSYVTLYLNGVEKTSTTNSSVINETLDGLIIGKFFSGELGSVALYGRSKSPEEVRKAYQNENPKYIGFTDGKFGQGLKIEDPMTLSHPVKVKPDSTCVGKWTFNKGSGGNASDMTGNDNTGLIMNGTNWVNGRVGKALNFDGTNDWVDCGNDNSLTVGGGDFTISAWINFPGAMAGLGDLVGKRNKITSVGWVWHVTPTVTRLWTSSYGGVDYFYNFEYNQWYHLVMVRDKSNALVHYYINGEKKISVTGTSADVSNTGKLAIGRLSEDDYQYFKGKIDELSIYKRMKTSDEILSDYQSYENFDEKQGTLELYIKPNWNGNDGKRHTIFYCGNDPANNSFLIHKTNDNKLKFISTDNKKSSQNNPTVDVANWLKNQWYHLAFTWTSTGTKQIYIDGHLMATETNNKMPTNLYSRLYIGSIDENIKGFDGVIDAVRISDNIRSFDEIREYYPVGYYESPVIDVTDTVEWGTIRWNSSLNPGTSMGLQTSTSSDNITWTNWTGNSPKPLGGWFYIDSSGERVNADKSRYIKWRAVLRSADGTFTPVLESVNITWNNLPKALNISVTPAEPTVVDDLIVNYTFFDADNDTEGDTKFQWYVDQGNGYIFSGIDNQILSSTNTKLGEKWYCNIIPHDGESFGIPVQTEILIIELGPIARIDIVPKNVTITTEDEIKFFAVGFDAEDNIVVTTFQWSITGGGEIDQTGKFIPAKTGVHGVYAMAGDITGSTVVEVLPGAINKVEISPKNPVIMADETLQFEAIILDTKGNFIPDQDQDANWTVSGGGEISAIGLFDPDTVGTWTVTLDLNGTKDTTNVEVIHGIPVNIDLQTVNPEITTDDELPINITITDSDGNAIPIQPHWDLENGEVTPDGVYIPDTPGTWEIIMTVPGTDLSLKTNITVLRGLPKELIIEPQVVVLKVNETQKFTVTGVDNKGNSWLIDSDLIWTISDTSLGYISTDGTFNAVEAGKVTVTAKYTFPIDDKTNDNKTNGGNGNGNGNGNETNGNETNGNSSRAGTRADEFITSTAEVTIWDDFVPEPPKKEGDDDGESKEGEMNFGLLILFIILLIIVILLIVLLALSRRKSKPGPYDKAAVEEPESEPEEEYEEEAEVEAEDWDESEDVGTGTGGEEDSWEVVDEEEDEEVDDSDWESEPEEEQQVPKKGKMPIKGKFPKGKMPLEEEEEEDIWD